MSRTLLPAILGGTLGAGVWLATAGPAAAQPAPLPPPSVPAAPAPAYAPSPVPAPPGTFGLPPAAPTPIPYQTLNRFWYYPYYYYPANYWPATSPRWPETTTNCYQRPPAYMAYPPFREPHWRYEWWEPQNHYRGFHFWLDSF
jgi:hypothetical protein